jgi:diguanylate cyclase (GGDEF)-like protein
MDDIKEILETLRTNQEIARKFFEIESSILSVFNFKDLFERLLAEIKEKFGIPYVWISMIDKSKISNLVQSLISSEIIKERLNVIDRNTFLDLTENKITPILANDDLKPFYKLLPPKQKYLIRSLAIAPITLDGEIIGSLNHADHSELRYWPGMDTSLLEQLAVKVSICLSNVMAHEQLRSLAFRDPLTGLLNRRTMDNVLKREFNRAKRYATPLSLLFLDLDDFKVVNGLYGHDIGDDLLKYVAKHLEEMSRKSDVVARFAGDEFVIILPSTPLKKAQNLVNRLQNFFQKNPPNFDGISIPILISFGIASIEDETVTDAASLLKKADTTLYEAKKLKRGYGTDNPAIE